MSIGTGCYALCNLNTALATGARHFLVHLNPKLAAALRQADPWALIGLRPDAGRDWEQVDASLAPEAEARRWADLIRGRVSEAGVGVYNYTLGINEPLGMPLDWLAAFEHAVCRHVQYGEGMPADWRQLAYACISGQVGHLEPSEVPLFRRVLEAAWAVNLHAYLAPNVKRLADEPGDWHVWRPLRLLWPEVVKINPRTALLLGECGTYYPPGQMGISKDDEARVQVEIARAYEQEMARRGYHYVGAVSYGIGLDGDQMEPWDLSGQVGIFASANGGASAPAQASPVVSAPPVKEDTKVSDAEIMRYAADLYHRFGVPWNPGAAFTRYFVDKLKAGRFLGVPLEPEHASENGQWMIQAFANTILHCKVGEWVVREGLPPLA